MRMGKNGVSAMMSGESGQAQVLAVLCLTVIMGGMALAIDVGNLHYQQRKLQTAADAAAIAAGLEIGNCGNATCANMNTAAQTALIEEGITTATITPINNQCTAPSSSGLAMIINVSPCVLGAIDPNYGNAHMAEVVLTRQETTIFGAFVGMKKVNLVARAEAGEAYINNPGGGNCIYTKSFEFNSSNGIFTLKDCGIYDDGFLQTNDHDGVTASSFLYYGLWGTNNCNNSCTWKLGNSQTQPAHTTTQQADPLASLKPPSKPANSSTYNKTTPNSGDTLQPGYYPYGINLNSNVSVTLAPGLYYMNGSINVNSGATLTGTGVELFFANGTLQLNSGSTAQLSAPTTTSASAGTTAGMLDWQPTSNSSGMAINSGSSSYFNGVIYLPNAQLTLNSGSGVTINSGSSYTALDVKDLMVNSSVNFVINGSGGYLGGSSKILGTFAVAE